MSDEVNKVYPSIYLEQSDEDSKIRDPHIWTSPKRVKVIIQIIADELSLIDSTNKMTYQNNAKKYINKLSLLDATIRSYFKDVTKKTFIVYHPELGYFAQDYGLKMLYIEKEGKGMNAKEMKELINTARMNGIKTVFCQSEFDSKQAQIFASNIEGKVVSFSVLSPHYIENLEWMARAISSSLK